MQAKLEYFKPLSRVMDRDACAIVETAEKQCLLQHGFMSVLSVVGCDYRPLIVVRQAKQYELFKKPCALRRLQVSEFA